MWYLILGLWFRINEKIRFVLVGGFNTLVNFVIFHIFTTVCGNSFRLLSMVISWLISSVIAYITHKIFVFRSSGKWLDEYFMSLWSRLFLYFVVAAIINSFCEILGFNAYLSLFIINIFNAFSSYFLLKYFAFGVRNGC
jgi:putative flippase GtrA